ncbi:expressed protein [Phakopsora pachyrhizi]|uniref:Expressed protein n=1 Tax=Phakopsora pachyrhizi TaxID=170000 RepID=A0AAV0BYJ1_PHAPC|nr:expressed protein [Phakopsora pachyrhizi]
MTSVENLCSVHRLSGQHSEKCENVIKDLNVDENASTYQAPEIRKDSQSSTYKSELQSKWSDKDECSLHKSPLQPILMFHVPEVLSSNNSSSGILPLRKPLTETSRNGLPLAFQNHVGNVSAAKKTNKNPNLNISIPPLPRPASWGLNPSSASGDSNTDPFTPIFQIVHTPTIAPGAPRPADPAEIRRLEKSWAENITNFDQLSPAFPNFLPPKLSNISMDELTSPDAALASPNFGKDDDSEEMITYALPGNFPQAASKKTLTFPPLQRTLSFGKGNDNKMY